MLNCHREVQRLRESCATSSSVVSISSEVWKAAAAWARRQVCIATAGVPKYYVVYSIFYFLRDWSVPTSLVVLPFWDNILQTVERLSTERPSPAGNSLNNLLINMESLRTSEAKLLG